MTIAEENDLIERLAECIRFLGCGDEDGMEPGRYDEMLEFAHGHQGEGWYLSCGEYPEEGSVFIGALEYGALKVAQAIVAEERAWLVQARAAKLDALGAVTVAELAQALPRAPEPAAVSFQARLMALGDAAGLAADLPSYLGGLGDQPVLLFTVDVPEARKAGPLLRRLVSLTAVEVGP